MANSPLLNDQTRKRRIRVVTQSGKKGRTYHRNEVVNGKIQVFLDDGTKQLCDQANLKIFGYID